MSESFARYDEGVSSIFDGTFEDEDEVAIPLSNLASVTLNVRDPLDATVNGRSNVNCLAAGDVTVETSGAFVYHVRPLDLTIATPDPAVEDRIHRAIFKAVTSDSKPRTHVHTHYMWVTRRVGLCSLSMVLNQFDSATQAAAARDPRRDEYIYRAIAAVSRRSELYTNRRIRKSFAPNYTRTVFQIPDLENHGVRAVRLFAYPIDSIVSVKESYEGGDSAYWSALPALATTDYIFDPDLELSKEGFVKLRYRDFLPGTLVEVIHAGGIAVDVSGVPHELAMSCARQAAFMFQHKNDLGVSSVSVPEAGSVTVIETDLLDDVEAVWRLWVRVDAPS